MCAMTPLLSPKELCQLIFTEDLDSVSNLMLILEICYIQYKYEAVV